MRAFLTGDQAEHTEADNAWQLLKTLQHGSVMAPDQLEDGIIRLLFRLHDLVLDTPNAPHLLALFVQRLIFDELLPRSFAALKVPASLVVDGTLGGEFASKLSFLLKQEASGVKEISPDKVLVTVDVE